MTGRPNKAQVSRAQTKHTTLALREHIAAQFSTLLCTFLKYSMAFEMILDPALKILQCFPNLLP